MNHFLSLQRINSHSCMMMSGWSLQYCTATLPTSCKNQRAIVVACIRATYIYTYVVKILMFIYQVEAHDSHMPVPRLVIMIAVDKLNESMVVLTIKHNDRSIILL